MARSARTGIELRAFAVAPLALALACQRGAGELRRDGSPGGARPAVSSTPSAPQARVYDEATTAITAKVGERFTVALGGSTARPFEWRLASTPDAAVLVLVDRGYAETPAPGCEGCGGGDGAFTFTFEASGRGATSVRFVYGHVAPDDSKAAKDVTIAVRVE